MIILIIVIFLTFLLTLLIVVKLPSIYLRLERIVRPIHLVDTMQKQWAESVYIAALKMAKSDRVTMVWEEDSKSAKDLFLKIFQNRKNSSEFQKYNYPRAFLFLGIISYLKKNKNKEQLILFKTIFDKYIKDNGEPNFTINRIDQAPFGAVALDLYEIFSETKYLKFADCIFEYLESNIDKNENIIDYRPNLDIVLNDMLGLVIPFLLEYARIANSDKAKLIAEQQINYFNNYGVDINTQIPVHGVNKLTKTKIGSANWGRGIGWYFIGLSYCTKYNNEFAGAFEKLKSTLLSLRLKEKIWSQFPGSSHVFDASSTLMFFYSILINDKKFITEDEFFKLLKGYLTKDGVILQTSGDTFGLNDYSKTFGNSELSQGLLLLVLSEIN